MITSLLLAVGIAQAADPKFDGTEKAGAAVEKPEGKLTAEFGGALTTGNSEFYTLGAGINGSYRWQRSKFSLSGGGIMGRSRLDEDADGILQDDELAVPMKENARRFFGDVRYDFFLSSRDSLYVLVGAYHDRFAGFDFRIHEQVGYSRHLVKNDSTNLIGEIGVDFAQENFVEGVDPNSNQFVAARGMLNLKHKFSEGVGFEDTVEVFENVMDFEDFRLLNTASIVSALGSKMSLKLSHSLIFDNQPVEGYRKLDQAMQITLVASIL